MTASARDRHAEGSATRRTADAVRADPVLRARLKQPLSAREKARLAAEIVLAYVRVRTHIRREKLPVLLAALRDGVRDPGTPAWEAAGEHVRAVRIARPVLRVLPRLPGDTRCLTQSLVLTALLARRGIGSTLVIAVAPADELIAHAWVEHGGVPLLPPGGQELARLVEL